MTSTAGYSGTPLSRKLGIKPGMRVALLDAPSGFQATLGPPPEGVELRPGLDVPADMVIAFVVERAALERTWALVSAEIGPHCIFWVAWPKRASKVATDMSDGVARAVILPSGWVDTKVCAIDAVWSGLKFVLRKELRPAGRR